MLARSLSVSAAAALALVPGVASAAPTGAAPVDNSFSEGYSAQAAVVLPDGREASVWLGEYRSGHQDGWWGELYLEVDCESYRSCLEGGSGMDDLTDAQVEFSRSLNRASATGVTLTLYTWDDPWAQNQVERQVTVSVEFAGTGQSASDADHGDLCWSMGATCQSVTVDASRSATGTLTMDGETATGSGSLSHGQYLYVGAPR